MTDLGLNEHHNSCISAYLKFCKYQRSQSLRSVIACFSDIKDSSLMEDTYTLEEVEQIIDQLKELISTEVEGELLHASHTNSLLISNMFKQAQKWHLSLDIDTANLENKELLEAVRVFEDTTASGGISSPAKKNQLLPMSDNDGPHQLLQAEIARLNEDNQNLNKQLEEIHDKLANVLKENISLSEDVRASKICVDHLTNSIQARPTTGDITELSDEVEQMRLELSTKENDQERVKAKYNDDLTTTKHHLDQLRSQLSLAEKELEKKFSQTSAYQNMKKILCQKNDRLKDLHRRLKNYEPDYDCNDEF